jgi:hypothetical protein
MPFLHLVLFACVAETSHGIEPTGDDAEASGKASAETIIPTNSGMSHQETTGNMPIGGQIAGTPQGPSAPTRTREAGHVDGIECLLQKLWFRP